MTEAARVSFAFFAAPLDADAASSAATATPTATATTAATASARPLAAAETSTTRRPEPGLARGVWEAPRWAFFVAMVAIVVLAALYAARRAGLLRRRPRP